MSSYRDHHQTVEHCKNWYLFVSRREYYSVIRTVYQKNISSNSHHRNVQHCKSWYLFLLSEYNGSTKQNNDGNRNRRLFNWKNMYEFLHHIIKHLNIARTDELIFICLLKETEILILLTAYWKKNLNLVYQHTCMYWVLQDYWSLLHNTAVCLVLAETGTRNHCPGCAHIVACLHWWSMAL